MAFLKTATVVGLAAAVALTLGACREEESSRRAMYEPGVYKGKADTEISAQAKRSLKTRIRHQRTLGSGMGGGGAPGSAPPDVRPPASVAGGGGGGSRIPLDVLRQRIQQQNFN